MMSILRCLILIVVMSALAGCLAGKTKPQSTYLFNIQMPKQSLDGKNSLALNVRSMQAFMPFTSNEFIYRVSAGQYISDYYHTFLVPPAAQISDITANYLMGKNLFGYVGSPLHPMRQAKYSLQGSLVALYGDYRNSSHPTGVIAVRYILSVKQDGSKKVLMDKLFRQAVPLRAKTTTALLSAWNVGLSRIVSQLYRSLTGVVKD